MKKQQQIDTSTFGMDLQRQLMAAAEVIARGMLAGELKKAVAAMQSFATGTLKTYEFGVPIEALIGSAPAPKRVRVVRKKSSEKQKRLTQAVKKRLLTEIQAGKFVADLMTQFDVSASTVYRVARNAGAEVAVMTQADRDRRREERAAAKVGAR